MAGKSTSSRRPFTEVVQGLETTADKVRSLCEAGYFRTEIAKLLGIRYQHVRNVLKRSGMEGGLQSTIALELEPIEIEVPTEPPPGASWRLLLDRGFTHVGDWKLADSAGLELTAKAPKEPGVYAFVINDVIKYVGLTQRTFHQRMDNYKRGYARHRTSARIKKLIIATLHQKQTVKLLVACLSASTEWNGLPVNLAAGLEVGLIRQIQPEWNMLGVKTPPKS